MFKLYFCKVLIKETYTVIGSEKRREKVGESKRRRETKREREINITIV